MPKISDGIATRDVTFALWNKADLDKGTSSFETFLSKPTDSTSKAILDHGIDF